MNWKEFLRNDGYWMMAKEWVDVQRQGKLEAMSRKLAGGSQKSQRRATRLKLERGSQRQFAGLLAVLTLGAGIYDMGRPGESLLFRAIEPDTLLETMQASQEMFKSLNIGSGPGTAESLGGLPQASAWAPVASRTGTNGLQE
jgi:hypothetical protein